MYWYSIEKLGENAFVARYRRGMHGEWKQYSIRVATTWDGAYKQLEARSTPAALAVRFVGTF